MPLPLFLLAMPTVSPRRSRQILQGHVPRPYADMPAYQSMPAITWRCLQLFDPVFTLDADWVQEFCVEYGRVKDRAPSACSPASTTSICAVFRTSPMPAAGSAGRYRSWQRLHPADRLRQEDSDRADTGDRAVLCKAIWHRHHRLHDPGWTLRDGPTRYATVCDSARQLDCERQVYFIWKPLTEEGERRWRAAGPSSGRVSEQTT